MSCVPDAMRAHEEALNGGKIMKGKWPQEPKKVSDRYKTRTKDALLSILAVRCYHRLRPKQQ